MLNLSAVLEQHARRNPDAEAIVCGDTRLSYGQLNALANRVAGALAASGIRPGDHVALLCPNLPHFPAVYFGILKAGAIVVPLNVLLKPREIAYHLRDSDAKAMFCFHGTPELPMADAAKAAIAVVPACKQLIVIPHPTVPSEPDPDTTTFEQFLGRQPATFETRVTSPDDTAVILYTSGTTGQPKGAELTHLNMVMNGMVSAELCAGSSDENGRHANRDHAAVVSRNRADGADDRVPPPRRHAGSVAAFRSGHAHRRDGARARHALGRRADDVLDAAEACARERRRHLERGRDVAAGGVGRGADAGRTDEGLRSRRSASASSKGTACQRRRRWRASIISIGRRSRGRWVRRCSPSRSWS